MIKSVLEARWELNKQIGLAIQEELEKYKGERKMEKTRHTPGPWTIKDAERWADVLDGQEVMAEDESRLIARCHAGHLEEREANARLIATAPDLLEALRKISTCSRYPKNDTENPAFALDALRSIARDAIAKAEGRE